MILLEAWTSTYSAAGVRFDLSKQRIGHLAKRWKAWAVAQFGPRNIKPGEIDEKQEQQPADPVKPHVISFRVTDSGLNKLQSQAGGALAHSPHSVARFLLLRSLESAPSGDPEHRETTGSAP